MNAMSSPKETNRGPKAYLIGTSQIKPIQFVDDSGSSTPTIHPVELQTLGIQPDDPSLGPAVY